MDNLELSLQLIFSVLKKATGSEGKEKTDDPHLSKTHCCYRHCRTTA